MSEMALTADHLLVIGRGRMIADMPMSELMSRHSGDRVEVRSADPQAPGYQVVTSVIARALTAGFLP